MADAGNLQVRILHDGAAVSRVEIASTRPQAFRLLDGRTPEQAERMAPMLFGICGRAQGAAASAAVAAAQGRDLTERAGLERAIACEALQEHLWRLLLDWPQRLGLPQARDDFVRWHGMLREIAAGQAGMPALLAELESGWLGAAAGKWLTLESLSELQDWWQAADSPAARLFAALDAAGAALAPEGVPLLPAGSAGQGLEMCNGRLDAGFCAQPHWHGGPAETGALAFHAGTPLLRDVLHRRPSRVLARVLARAYDVLEIAGDCGAARLDSAAAGDGAALAAVKTSRGLLLHHVRIAGERVRDYFVVAPTEWNFHPRGALAAGLEGLRIDDPTKLARLAGLQALSLDPCVEYEVTVDHA